MLNKLKHTYEKEYKLLLLIPAILLLLAFAQIGFQYQQTGDFMLKGVSLSGGATITIPSDGNIDVEGLEAALFSFSEAGVSVRELRSTTGTQSGVIVDAALFDESEVESLTEIVIAETGIDNADLGVEFFGPSLGESFFRQTVSALFLAFLFMGCVVFLYFRTLVPSFAVMLAAFADIVVTLAIVNLMGVHLGTAGIAAFLMLIGYSVDTDILLTVRVVKRKDEGTLNERIYGAMKTGGMMTLTALAAVSVVLIFTNSDVLRQIMLILFIGLCVDLITTWIQNVCMLRWFMLHQDAKRKGDDV
jgi:preprotein translocase subunit SecF